MEVAFLICVLVFLIANLAFTIRVSIFLVTFATQMDRRLAEMQGEPPASAARTGRSLDGDSGLVDLDGVYNYDPRYTDPYTEDDLGRRSSDRLS